MMDKRVLFQHVIPITWYPLNVADRHHPVQLFFEIVWQEDVKIGECRDGQSSTRERSRTASIRTSSIELKQRTIKSLSRSHPAAYETIQMTDIAKRQVSFPIRKKRITLIFFEVKVMIWYRRRAEGRIDTLIWWNWFLIISITYSWIMSVFCLFTFRISWTSSVLFGIVY